MSVWRVDATGAYARSSLIQVAYVDSGNIDVFNFEPQRQWRFILPYHHGDLRAALLASAERLLERDGVKAVTLRAVARDAGVSHAAPKNHFDSLSGLLSELAAIGFERLAADAHCAMEAVDDRTQRLHALGRSYVRFALEQPGLFALMFRSELLDAQCPALRASSAALLDVLVQASGQTSARDISIAAAEHAALAWAQVHGLAVLLLEERLEPMIGRIAGRPSKAAFIERLIESS